MSASRLAVKHSIVEEDALSGWLSTHYELAQPVVCRLFRESMSDAYRVDTPEGAYFFKIPLRDRHSRAEIEAEVAFLNDLGRQGLPVALPVPGRDGASLYHLDVPEGTRYGVLYYAVAGEEPQETNPEHGCRLGELAARIHTCADRLGKRYSCWYLDEAYLIRDPIRHTAPYLEHRPADLAYLQRFGEDLIAELQGLLPKELPAYGICHGDLHTGNARLDPDGNPVLFDWDSFGYGWRALDIGVYVVSYDWMDLSREGKAAKARVRDAFLEGYSRVRTLSSNEIAALALAMPIRHLELMGLTMRYWAPVQGVYWITDEYFDQHVDWLKRWAGEYRHD